MNRNSQFVTQDEVAEWPLDDGLWKTGYNNRQIVCLQKNLARAVAAAKPFRSVSTGMKAPRRRNCGADGLTVDVLQKTKKNQRNFHIFIKKSII